MRERITGLETEYCLSHLPRNGEVPLDARALTNHVMIAARPRLPGWAGCSLFGTNGGKLYADVGHVEWATPECRTALEAVTYCKVGDRLMRQLAHELETNPPSGSPLSVLVARNNTDPHGATYGSHENYLVPRSIPEIRDQNEYFLYLAQVLLPFLTSRTVISGNGSVFQGYEISQRARFIGGVASEDTRHVRPILYTRDEPHSDAATYRRLHLILGDANMADWANYLKVGTTSLVLSMAEEAFLHNIPRLNDPVGALHTFSKDLTLKARVPTNSGSSLTALDIQRWYFEAATRFFDRPSPEEADILERWAQVLAELETNPQLCVGKLDWVTKRELLEQRRGEKGWADESLIALDLQYHNVGAEATVYNHLVESGLMETIVDDRDIERGLTEPPAFTRAQLRSKALKLGLEIESWTALGSREVFRVPDPFGWAPAGVLKRMNLPANEMSDLLKAGAGASNPAVRVQALNALPELATIFQPLADQLLISAIEDTDASVRAAATRAMSSIGPSRFSDALTKAAVDEDFRVRLEAQTASAG